MCVLNIGKQRTDSIFPERECIPVVNALKTGDHQLMKLLVENGCHIKLSGNAFYARKIASSMLREWALLLDEVAKRHLGEQDFNHLSYRRWKDFIGGMKRDSKEARRKFPRSSKLSSDFLHLFCDPLSKLRGVSFQRLFPLIFAIYAFMLELSMKPEANNFFKCLRIYFNAITIPYLTVYEVKEIFDDHLLEINENLFNEYSNLFDDIESFMARSYEPRKLSHLARCQIRNDLLKNKNQSLEVTLQQLQLPIKIKNFILCKPAAESSSPFISLQ